jgi:hypothetical protein
LQNQQDFYVILYCENNCKHVNGHHCVYNKGANKKFGLVSLHMSIEEFEQVEDKNHHQTMFTHSLLVEASGSMKFWSQSFWLTSLLLQHTSLPPLLKKPG